MKKKSATTLIFLALTFGGYAQLIDEQFRPLISKSAEIRAFAVQPDGKVIASGDIVLAGDKPVRQLVRLNADGTLDESFTPPDFIDERAIIQTIVVDHDGKVVVGGSFSNGTDAFRLHPDGSLDGSFALPSDIENIVKIDSYGDDQYVVLSFTYRKGLIIVNNDGSVDPSFNPGTGPDGMGIDGTDFAVLPDGGIIFAGSFSQFNNVDKNRVVRLKRDGSIDNTFSIGAGPQGSPRYINSVKVQSDGKILLAGKFESFDNANAVNIVRLHPDGVVDDSFVMPGPSANFFNYEIGGMALVNDNIFVAGMTQNVQGVSVLKLHSDGSIATDFTAPVSDISGNGHDPLLINGPDGIFLSGNFSKIGTDDRSGLAVLDRTTGELDSGFNPLLGGLPEIRTIRKDDNGSFVIGGRFHFVNGVRVQNLAKLHADGSLDEAFAANIGTGPDRVVNCIEFDVNGRILVAGGMTYFNNSYSGNLVRLNTDGTLDDTFAGSVYTPAVGLGVNALHLLSDGKLVIGGSFSQVNGQAIKRLARLENDGSTDATFYPPVFDDQQIVNAISFAADNHLLVGGNRHGGTYGGFLYQVDAQGSIVNDFQGVDLSNQSILTIEPLVSGGFLAAGTFSRSFSGSTPNALLQFNSEGFLVDKVSVAVYEGAIEDIMVMPDNHVLLSGAFRKVNTVPSSGSSIIRLNGQLSDVYHFDIAGYAVNAYQTDPGGSSLILCGWFSSVNGISAFGIAKVNMVAPAVPTDLAYEIDNAEGVVSVSWTDRAFNETGYQILREVEGVTTVIATTDANTTQYADVTAEPLKTYAYRVSAINGIEQSHESETVVVSTNGWVPPAPPENPTHNIADDFTSIEITWTDASDNEQGFEIERAIGDGNFSPINVTGPDVTVFTDEFSFDTRYRYRIRAYNNFGKSEYSPVLELPVILDVFESTAFSVYPNPANGVLHVEHTFQVPVRITLQDMAGKAFRDQKYEGGRIMINLQDVPPGLYLVTVQGPNRSKTMKVHKF